MGAGTLVAYYFAIGHIRVIRKEGKQLTDATKKAAEQMRTVASNAVTEMTSVIESSIDIDLDGDGQVGHQQREHGATGHGVSAPTSAPTPAG